MKQFWILSLLVLLACEKVDTILIEPDITLDLENVALLIGEEQQLVAQYKEAGVPVANSGIDYTWVSSDANVATVDANGNITAVGAGTATIVATAFGYESSEVVVNVVDNSDNLATITLTTNSGTAMLVNDTNQLSVSATTLGGDAHQLDTVIYTVSDPSVIQVSTDGKVTAIGAGEAQVTVSSDGITSNTISFNVSAISSRTTMLDGDHYQIEGTVTLELVDGDLILHFGPDFSSQNGPGLYIYLSNSTTGTAVIQNGIDLGALPQLSGEFEINVSELFPGTMLNDYDHVIIYCKPFTVTFGFGTLD